MASLLIYHNHGSNLKQNFSTSTNFVAGPQIIQANSDTSQPVWALSKEFPQTKWPCPSPAHTHRRTALSVWLLFQVLHCQVNTRHTPQDTQHGEALCLSHVWILLCYQGIPESAYAVAYWWVSFLLQFVFEINLDHS